MTIPVQHLKITDFTYDLPDERIAKFPLAERDQSKLLIYKNGKISTDTFTRLPDYIAAGDLLVFNNTRVIRARIEMEKETGARIEIFCLEPHLPVDYQQSFAQQSVCQWKCMVGNLKKWKSGTLKKTITYRGCDVELQAECVGEASDCRIIRFTWTGGIDFGTLLDACGRTPIPPYLNRAAEAIDETRYQTVYSKHKGSVAAPTAGLHFTPDVLQRLSDKGAETGEITLHVGAGTFRPVQQEDIVRHEMHVEFFSVRAELLRRIIANTGNVIATGTTSLRALESIYWIGVKMLHSGGNPNDLELGQWEAYNLPQHIDMKQSLLKVCDMLEKNKADALWASTKIMIVPGYKFRVCRKLITNFHQPQSTLLLLVGAFAGDAWRDIYRYALEHDFRFLSYGDSSLLELKE